MIWIAVVIFLVAVALYPPFRKLLLWLLGIGAVALALLYGYSQSQEAQRKKAEESAKRLVSPSEIALTDLGLSQMGGNLTGKITNNAPSAIVTGAEVEVTVELCEFRSKQTVNFDVVYPYGNKRTLHADFPSDLPNAELDKQAKELHSLLKRMVADPEGRKDIDAMLTSFPRDQNTKYAACSIVSEGVGNVTGLSVRPGQTRLFDDYVLLRGVTQRPKGWTWRYRVVSVSAEQVK